MPRGHHPGVKAMYVCMYLDMESTYLRIEFCMNVDISLAWGKGLVRVHTERDFRAMHIREQLQERKGSNKIYTLHM